MAMAWIGSDEELPISVVTARTSSNREEERWADGGRGQKFARRGPTERGTGEEEETAGGGIGDCRLDLIPQPFAVNSWKSSLDRATSNSRMEGGQHSLTSPGPGEDGRRRGGARPRASPLLFVFVCFIL